jgi:ParB family chromosome partitioning protein
MKLRRTSTAAQAVGAPTVVPTGELMTLRIDEVVPSRGNPRVLFDPEPLKDLRESIRRHGVLVPITVFPIKGQKKFGIIDGERRYRCCVDLSTEGLSIPIPANIVQAPSRLASLLYMFSIHNFRQAWELMPTALSLQIVMTELDEHDTEKLSSVTGLSAPQVERCKKLLSFPRRFQDLSLDPDPATRIPSNFWIEVLPVLDLCGRVLPDLVEELTREGITDKLVLKYRNKKIKSVIHFRRIMEAFETAENDEVRQRIIDRLREYILDPELETRRAFDEFVVEMWRVQGAIAACTDFLKQLERAKLDYTLENQELVLSLANVKTYIERLLEELKGGETPPPEEGAEEHK